MFLTHRLGTSCIWHFTPRVLNLVSLYLTHLLEVADPIQPPGSHICSEAVSRLSSEDRYRAHLFAVHPRLLYCHPVTWTSIDPEHHTRRRRTEHLNEHQCVLVVFTFTLSVILALQISRSRQTGAYLSTGTRTKSDGLMFLLSTVV